MASSSLSIELSNDLPAEGAQGEKRIRNDRAKRSAKQNELNLQKRQRQWAAAGVEGKYEKGARIALAVVEKEPHSLPRQMTCPPYPPTKLPPQIQSLHLLL